MNSRQLTAVTGAGGLVGGALCRHFGRQHLAVRPLVRTLMPEMPEGTIATGDLVEMPDLAEALAGVDCLVHCAARVHVMNDTAEDPLSEFRLANTDTTRHLATQAVAAGVKRMILISTVKVLGESTPLNHPFTHHSRPLPQDPYAMSKLEAEVALQDVAESGGMEWVVIRPPLVYGPGVRANLQRLIQLIGKGWPLPFGSIHNRRAMIGLDNLVSLIERCTMHPDASGQAFLASDDKDLSTPGLIRNLADAMDMPAHLWPVPPAILKIAGHLTGRSHEISRLTGSLGIDLSETQRRLAWSPPLSVTEGLRRCVQTDKFK